ncbi:thioredoxin reductase (NADPH) [Monoraphidium neglectum]|uniref:Thioredoxin reductase (NADPH) n=1 Tax=Monoraphidium neglectum TaxID=145388 RepID=A0A0D2KSM0_9CHLO|nr:thioredoxin reductase (NADPH) [Monoraphidium neglectum]KIY98533.1 thioredoxin reductase (NADPH) [Monoraphidium neglectum]|eukprot:XP_013897553.1 thioredoxin reductase (NADPH) [Monoraphidium neglectum]
MQKRALEHPKITVLWDSAVEEAYGNERNMLGGVKVRNVKTGELTDLPISGLFFAIGHEPATKFLDGQLKLDEAGYIVTAPDSTATSIEGVFAAGDVQDHVWRQAITAAGTGCMAALEAERFLEAHGHAAVDGGPAAIEEDSAADKAGAKEPALVAA